MLVELETGAPLFPGSSDVDQLWCILQCLCSPSLGYAGSVQSQAMFKVCVIFLAWVLHHLHSMSREVCSVQCLCPWRVQRYLQADATAHWACIGEMKHVADRWIAL